MSILKELGGAVGAFFSGGTGEILDGAGTLIKSVGDASVSIREALTGEPSPEKMADALKRLDELITASNDMQGRINLAEAQSGSLFVAGWRPGIGWVCVLALGLYFPTRILTTMVLWAILAWQGIHSAAPSLPPVPEMGIQDVLGLVTSMLGLAWLRSKDKEAGVSR